MLGEKYAQYTPLMEIEKFLGMFKRLQAEKMKMERAKNVPLMTEEEIKRIVGKTGCTDSDKIEVSAVYCN